MAFEHDDRKPYEFIWCSELCTSTARSLGGLHATLPKTSFSCEWWTSMPRSHKPWCRGPCACCTWIMEIAMLPTVEGLIIASRKAYEFIGVLTIMLKNHIETYGFWAWWSKSLWIHMLSAGICISLVGHGLPWLSLASFGFQPKYARPALQTL